MTSVCRENKIQGGFFSRRDRMEMEKMQVLSCAGPARHSALLCLARNRGFACQQRALHQWGPRMGAGRHLSGPGPGPDRASGRCEGLPMTTSPPSFPTVRLSSLGSPPTPTLPHPRQVDRSFLGAATDILVNADVNGGGPNLSRPLHLGLPLRISTRPTPLFLVIVAVAAVVLVVTPESRAWADPVSLSSSLSISAHRSPISPITASARPVSPNPPPQKNPKRHDTDNRSLASTDALPGAEQGYKPKWCSFRRRCPRASRAGSGPSTPGEERCAPPPPSTTCCFLSMLTTTLDSPNAISDS